MTAVNVIVDPIEAVINLISSDLSVNAITNGQIANQHRYGQQPNNGDWPIPSNGLTISWSGGTPDLYADATNATFEARMIGDTYSDCGKIWKTLATFLRTSNEQAQRVMVSEGTALVHWVVPVSQPVQEMEQLSLDDTIQLPVFSMTLDASILQCLVN